MLEHLHCVRFIEILFVHILIQFTLYSNISIIDFIVVLYFYSWFCVVSLYQIIFVVNSTGYRELYGDNPLKLIKKQMETKRTAIRIKGRVKFNLPPQKIAKPNPPPKIDKNRKEQRQTDPLFINQSLRQRNDYIEMRRNYLNQSSFDISHGQNNSRF